MLLVIIRHAGTSCRTSHVFPHKTQRASAFSISKLLSPDSSGRSELVRNKLSQGVRLCPSAFVTIAHRSECKTKFLASCSKFWNDRWGLREDLDKRAHQNIKTSRCWPRLQTLCAQFTERHWEQSIARRESLRAVSFTIDKLHFEQSDSGCLMCIFMCFTTHSYPDK